MPKVLSRTPDWLSHGAAGSKLFARKTQGKQTIGSQSPAPSSLPLKILARRGTEVFVAVENEIRWSDLVYLQELGRRRSDSQSSSTYKILQHKVHGRIEQLIVSPREDHLAIVTSHTIYIAVLPDSTDLDGDGETIKLRHFQLGPTAHVLDQPSLASAIWHPLGEEGRCLVTITTDAVLRVWEVNSKDRSSFQNPTLSVDLKKLANATSAGQDLRASTFGAATPFSPDTAELEPAGACFGGSGALGEDPWSAMTLWIATKEGDAYALCPLLPSRWQVSDPHTSSMVLAGVANAAEEDRSDTDISRWVLEIADQEPILKRGNFGAREASLFTRPERPSAIPKLQGPYVLIPQPGDNDEDVDDNEICDILVTDIGASLDQDDADFDEDLTDDASQGLPSLIALATTDGQIHIALNLERVEPQWLPRKGQDSTAANNWALPEGDFRALIVTETIRLQENTTSRMNIALIRDCDSPFSLFAALPGGIAFMSMDSWLRPLREELIRAVEDKTDSRLDLLFSQYSTLTDYPVTFQSHSTNESAIVAPIVLKDSDLGYFLLCLANGGPYAASFDTDDVEQEDYERDYSTESPEGVRTLALMEPEAREPYQPAQEFYTSSRLSSIIDDLPAHHRNLLKDQVKLSPMSLEALTKAHRMLANETNLISVAAADLFRRCKRLLEEFHGQVQEVDELATKVHAIQSSNNSGSALQDRLEKCNARSLDLIERRKKLSRKLVTAGQRELSEKEHAWEGEVDDLAHKILDQESDDSAPDDLLLQRFEQVLALREGLIKEAKQAVTKGKAGEKPASGHVYVPSQYRKQKLAQVDALLESESALIEAVSRRLHSFVAKSDG